MTPGFKYHDPVAVDMRLDDVRVLDLTRLLPGPYATALLADLGADVIKVEDPDVGDYARWMPPTTPEGIGGMFAALNRGKRSVALDLKEPDERAAFERLVDDADALIEGFRPGVTERLGVDYETVSDRNPEIVYCSVTGYGQAGPYRDRAGHDLNYVGLAGLLDMTRRDEDEAPRIPGYPIADMGSGMAAAFAVVSGLLARELGDGSGTYVDLSMTDVALSFSQAVTVSAALGADPRPGETELTGALPWYDVYETSDGRYVTLGALEPKFWRAFCDAVDRSDLASLHGTDDPAEREALREELASIFADRSRSAWEDLGEPEVPVEPVLTPREALEHPQVEARGLIADGHRIASPVGAGPTGGAERTAADADDDAAAVPGHGEHTASVLAEAGVDPEEVDRIVGDR